MKAQSGAGAAFRHAQAASHSAIGMPTCGAAMSVPLPGHVPSLAIHLAAHLLCPMCSQVGSSVLAASCFTKALAYHIAAECGFHVRRWLGGFMFRGDQQTLHCSAINSGWEAFCRERKRGGLGTSVMTPRAHRLSHLSCQLTAAPCNAGWPVSVLCHATAGSGAAAARLACCLAGLAVVLLPPTTSAAAAPLPLASRRNVPQPHKPCYTIIL